MPSSFVTTKTTIDTTVITETTHATTKLPSPRDLPPLPAGARSMAGEAADSPQASGKHSYQVEAVSSDDEEGDSGDQMW